MVKVIIENKVAASDNRLKHNEVLITNALENIRKLIPYRYLKTENMYDENHNFSLDASNHPIDDSGNRVFTYIEDGFIAQDVMQIEDFKHFVNNRNVTNEPFTLNYEGIFVNTVAALQDLDELHKKTQATLQDKKTIVSILEAKNNDLKTQINSILTRLSTLENN